MSSKTMKPFASAKIMSKSKMNIFPLAHRLAFTCWTIQKFGCTRWCCTVLFWHVSAPWSLLLVVSLLVASNEPSKSRFDYRVTNLSLAILKHNSSDESSKRNVFSISDLLMCRVFMIVHHFRVLLKLFKTFCLVSCTSWFTRNKLFLFFRISPIPFQDTVV